MKQRSDRHEKVARRVYHIAVNGDSALDKRHSRLDVAAYEARRGYIHNHYAHIGGELALFNHSAGNRMYQHLFSALRIARGQRLYRDFGHGCGELFQFADCLRLIGFNADYGARNFKILHQQLDAADYAVGILNKLAVVGGYVRLAFRAV